ncbi:MAG: CoA pyrophosphatase [Sphingomonadales bacterium]|nr:CoA pyrophosphatase [Sphingomonadales bacterium]
MSGVHARLARRYRAGKAQPEQLWEDPRLTGGESFRPAAVLIAVTERAAPGVLLIHRPSHMRAHPGQIAFPGGSLDPGEDAERAALREAEEELGIDPARVRVIGPADRYHSGSGFAITPVLATVPADIAITPNPAEVAQWFEAPLDHVLDPANQVQQWIDYEGVRHPFIEIVWREHRIWGVTAAILYNLARRLGGHDAAAA